MTVKKSELKIENPTQAEVAFELARIAILAADEAVSADLEESSKADATATDVAAKFDAMFTFNWTLRRDGKKDGDRPALLPIDKEFLNTKINGYKKLFEDAGKKNFDQRMAYYKKMSAHYVKPEPKDKPEPVAKTPEARMEEHARLLYKAALDSDDLVVSELAAEILGSLGLDIDADEKEV